MSEQDRPEPAPAPTGEPCRPVTTDVSREPQAPEENPTVATPDLELRQAIMVHELRTPLTAIKGYAQLLDRQLKRPAPDSGRLTDLVGQLQLQIERLEMLLSDLPGVAPRETDRIALTREPVDLIELARHAVARFERVPERTPSHQMLLDVAPPAEPLIGLWDPTRIDQMLDNLLGNALKYSPRGGNIRIQVRRSGTYARLAISDQGIGIAPEVRHLLFRPFARGDRARKVAEGSGLGLYITAQIVASHGGTITVSSQPGLGSTFIVWLPLQSSHPADPGA